ncbi:hypothetical protein PGTUg99_004205 [Puccinia graminis f. sp. tritici]|uniref:Uncharacterized protein n=1 Tax=Puccinia graminis f. sp. tritici TaxID=56615 RepID=A0A5B0P8V9_PUCGR|nr:hypothetical protein PGTUg99_004205 [Puccinia graminis f. sp. tritici]
MAHSISAFHHALNITPLFHPRYPDFSSDYRIDALQCDIQIYRRQSGSGWIFISRKSTSDMDPLLVPTPFDAGMNFTKDTIGGL